MTQEKGAELLLPWEKEQRKRDKGRKGSRTELTREHSSQPDLPVLWRKCSGGPGPDLLSPGVSCPRSGRAKAFLSCSWKSQICSDGGRDAILQKVFLTESEKKNIMSWRREGTILVKIFGWCPLGYSCLVTGSTLPIRHCQSGNSEKRNKREREDWTRLSELSCLCHLAERQNRYASKSANIAKISRFFFYACEKDLTRKKKKKDVTKEKSCNTVGLKASVQKYFSS